MKQINKAQIKLMLIMILGLLLIIYSKAFCRPSMISIQSNEFVVEDRSYNYVILKLDEGQFTVANQATLTIQNSVIEVTISAKNPYFIHLRNGNLILKNNRIKVLVKDLPQTPNNQSLYYLIKIFQGIINIDGNHFSVYPSHTLGLLITDEKYETNNFVFKNNRIEFFHGGLYFINSNVATVTNNFFFRVSFGNIFNIGNNNQFIHNTFQFPGNLTYGDAFDILSSNNILIKDNTIENDSCYGMQIFHSKNVTVENNYFMNGITYAIAIYPNTLNDSTLSKLANELAPNFNNRYRQNEKIVITHNYFSQNRFGVTGHHILDLVVNHNVFIQKFNNAFDRKFWTDNSRLLTSVSGLKWADNWYHEAYTQDGNIDPQQTSPLLPYPISGGVVLP